MDEESTVLEDIRKYLQYQVTIGCGEIVLSRLERTASPTQLGGTLEAVRQELGECSRCPLHRTRRSIVFGEGNPQTRLVFVGEGPGADEDREGRPFVGKAGSLLTKMIQAMGREREDVYICNVVKCRPPGNRDPEAPEIGACMPYLKAQILAVKPAAIVTLGRVAAHALLQTQEPMSRLRGRFHDWNGIPLMPTYHPSFLLRKEQDRRYKAETWADLKQVMALLNLPLSTFGD
jgi:DNA polymerase